MPVTNNIDGLIFKLQELENKTKNMEPVMKKIASAMASKVRMNFRKQQDPEGNPWVKSKRAIQDNGMTLSDTGRLKNSITYTYDGTSARAGTNVKYARVMHFGASKGAFGRRMVTQRVNPFTRTRKGRQENVRSHTRRREIETPWGDISSRKFLGMTVADKDKYLEMIKEHLERD